MKTIVTRSLLMGGLLATTVMTFAQDARYSSKEWLRPVNLPAVVTIPAVDLKMAEISSKPWLHPQPEFSIAFMPDAPGVVSKSTAVWTIGGEKSPIDRSYSSKPWLIDAP